MKSSWIFALLITAACASGSSTFMTMESFQDIPIGTSTSEVIAAAGKPYAVHKNKDGTCEYEYIERFKAGGRNIEERHYYLIIKDGKVTSKRVKQSSPSPYGFDSYDMQTTQNNPSSAE